MSLIKKSDVNAAPPSWHPNFRNYERLPDTKVVRTTFFINVTAIAVAACLVILVGSRQLRLRELSQQLQETQAVIDKTSKENTESIRLSKLFDDEAKKILEAGAFVKRTLAPSEFILLLGKSLPKEVQIESVDLRYSGAGGDQCVLRGIVAGSKDEASGAASKYIELLRTSPLFASRFESVTLPTLNPDPAGALMRFEIVIKLATAGKEKKS